MCVLVKSVANLVFVSLRAYLIDKDNKFKNVQGTNTQFSENLWGLTYFASFKGLPLTTRKVGDRFDTKGMCKQAKFMVILAQAVTAVF